MNIWRIGSNWGGEDIFPLFKRYKIAFAGKEKQKEIKSVMPNDLIAITNGQQIIGLGRVTGLKELNQLNQDLAQKYDDVMAIELAPLYIANENGKFGFYAGQGKQFHQAHNEYFKLIKDEFSKMERKQNMQTYIDILKANKNLVLTGAPGTGKSFLAKEIAKNIISSNPPTTGVVQEIFNQISVGKKMQTTRNAEFEITNNNADSITISNSENNESSMRFSRIWHDNTWATIADNLSYHKAIQEYIKKKVSNKLYDNFVAFVQFHPSYDYTDFIEGLRPVKKEDKLGFELRNGIFKEFCKKAKNDPSNQYVFIIDEINRAEISKVFGELFYSIDPGYRGKKGQVKTQYNNIQTEETCFLDKDNDYFYIPDNVYIIGTMNDIDRSVESFDFAMRRRFAWVEVKAEDRKSMWDGNIETCKDEANKKMTALNAAIDQIGGLGKAYHIGPAYFLKLKDYGDDFKKLWDYHIGIILNEYLRGMPDASIKLDELKVIYQKAK